jgi:hypothetical protein
VCLPACMREQNQNFHHHLGWVPTILAQMKMRNFDKSGGK